MNVWLSMQLILASKEKFLLEKGYDLLGIPKEELRIGAITTALNKVVDQVYLAYMEEYRQDMKNSGISFTEFDIEDKNEEEIMQFFEDKNVVQVFGGNPFYLIKNIRSSGFDNVLKKLLDKGLSYVGCSSGSYIMCPTVEVGGWKVDRNRYGVTDPTALKYVDFLIKCHYTDDQKEKVLEKMKDLKYPLKVLKDDQLLFIKDGEIKFIGNSEEVILG